MSQPAGTGFLNKTVEVNGARCRYVVYVPESYTPGRKWPLVLFLHGMGERGDDGLRQASVGIGKAIREHPERFPCIVVMPQCQPGQNWQGPMLDMALRTVDDAVAEYNIDQDRIVLSGLSMGGFGTWLLGATHTDRFSCLVPICGGGDPTAAEKLAKLPVWCWHGAADEAVSVDRSREMIRWIRQAGGNVKYTELPGVGHNSWDTAYGDPELVAWMLAQKRK